MNRLILGAFAILLAVALAGCQKTTTGSVYGVNATSGVEHTEPVHFNGQRYQVTFQYQSSASAYDVSVRRPGNPLRNTARDKASSVEVMSSALKHFACGNGQKAHVTPGTESFSGKQAWTLKAKCA